MQKQTTLIFSDQSVETDSNSITILDDHYATEIKQFCRMKITMINWPEIASAIKSEDIQQQHYAVIGIRKLVSSGSNAPVQFIIDQGLLPTLVKLGKQNQYLQIQFQCLWALTNMCSGTSLQTHLVVEQGGLDVFLECLKSPITAIAEQSMWAVGNLAGDSAQLRDLLIAKGVVQNLTKLISQNLHISSIIKNGTWALGNLCLGEPHPEYDLIRQGVHFCCKLLVETQISDHEILSDLLWVISDTEKLKNDLDPIFGGKLILKLASLLTSNVHSEISHSLQILGIFFENEYLAQHFMKNNGMVLLHNLLSHHKKEVRKSACFAIRRITSIHTYQVSDLFSNPKFVSELLSLFEEDASQVKIQIAFLFSNLSCQENIEKVYQFYLQHDLVRFYNSMLHGKVNSIESSLECLEKILEVGQKCKGGGTNKLASRLVDLEAVFIIQDLKSHSSSSISQLSSKLFQVYFDKTQFNQFDEQKMSQDDQDIAEAGLP